jgi:integrase
VRAEIEDLRAYDLRHTFATRLLERGVHHFVISALLGHSTPMTGFGFSSRMTPGYAHATWDTMVAAVATLDEPLQLKKQAARMYQVRKVG